jgi:hypothetical protein
LKREWRSDRIAAESLQPLAIVLVDANACGRFEGKARSAPKRTIVAVSVDRSFLVAKIGRTSPVIS